MSLQSHELVPLDEDYFMMKSLRSEMNFAKKSDLRLTNLNIPLDNTDEENIGPFQRALTEHLILVYLGQKWFWTGLNLFGQNQIILDWTQK